MATGFKADGVITIGTSVDVGGMNTGLYKIQKTFQRMARIMTLAVGVKAFYKLGKAATDAASDLQEVQNIVDVAFGKGTSEDMSSKIEAFAATCIKNFGISEMSAKETAGSFMAMGKAMDLTADESSYMAVKLTALTGDMSSFFNISQNYARVALSAVYTGETETLKRYGIVLTEANLQTYANTLGIQQNVKSMNARDKALLRYKYIMHTIEQMGIEGDFIRTQDNWANSVRVLKEVWNQFMIALGDGMISVLTPLVKVITTIVQRMIEWANVMWAILENIFHFRKQSIVEEMAQLAEDTEDSADAYDDLAESIGDTAAAAKKALSPIDDLNRYQTTKSSSSDTGEDLLNLGDLDLGLDELDEGEKKIDEFLSSIDNLFDFGKLIANRLSVGLGSIDWTVVYEKFAGFGKGLADFLNGTLTDTDLFTEIGVTVGSLINAGIANALAFNTTFDWTLLGQNISDGINAFFNTADFSGLAEGVNTFIQGLFDTFVTVIQEVDWSLVLKSIGEFFKTLDPETIWILVGFFAIKKAIKLFFYMSLASLIKKWFISSLKKGLDVKKDSEIVSAIVEALSTNIAAGIGLIAVGIPTYIMGLYDSIINGIDALSAAVTAAGSTMVGAGIGVIIGGTAGPIGAAVGAIIGILTDLFVWWAQTNETFQEGWSHLWDSVVTIWNSFTNILITAYDTYIKPMFEGIKKYVLELWEDSLKPLWDKIVEFLSAIGEVVGVAFTYIGGLLVILWNQFKPFVAFLVNVFGATFNTVFSFIGNVVGTVVKTVINLIGDVIDVLKGIIKFITGVFTGDWKKCWEGIVDIFSCLLYGIADIGVGIFNILIDVINGVLRAITNGINVVKGVINSLSLDLPEWLGGGTVGFNLPMSVYTPIEHLSIPRLAKGAVIPPNKEFMAILGDQTSGTNIEAPLETIKQAVAEVLSSSNLNGGNGVYTFIGQINRKVMFEEVITEAQLRRNQSGRNPFNI